MQQPLLEELKAIRPTVPSIPLYSTVTSRKVESECHDAKYWWSNVRQSVMFANTVRHITEDYDPQVWIEISPHPVLSQSLTDCLSELKSRTGGAPQSAGPLLVHSLKRKTDEQLTMLSALASLYTVGAANIDWAAVLRSCRGASDLPLPRPFVHLPHYAWNHEKYWLDILATGESQTSRPASNNKQTVSSGHPLLGSKLDSASTHVWENTISTKSLPWLADHAVQGAFHLLLLSPALPLNIAPFCCCSIKQA